MLRTGGPRSLEENQTGNFTLKRHLGGQFTRIRGQTISGLAGLNSSDVTVNWNPQFSGNVNAMRLADNLLYVGGTFSSVGSSNVQNLAAIMIDTQLATGWNPAPDQAVLTLEVSGDTVYAGGQFQTIGTKPRNRLASLDTATAIANTWNPNPNGIVRALALAGSSLYVGGDFTTIGGQNRRGFAAVNTGNGAAQSLNIQIQVPGTPPNLVRSILVLSNSLYVAGGFTNALGGLRPLLVGVDLGSGQAIPVPLGSDFNGAAGAVFGGNAMAAANGQVLIGGDFQSIGGVPRQRAAALSRTTGAALPWAPGFSAPVLSLAYGTNRIYVGGSFTNLNETNFVRGLVALNPLSGNPIPFSFQGSNQSGADVSITALLVTSIGYMSGASLLEWAINSAVSSRRSTRLPRFPSWLSMRDSAAAPSA